MFSLAFDLLVHNVVQLLSLFLQDLEVLRVFSYNYKHQVIQLFNYSRIGICMGQVLPVVFQSDITFKSTSWIANSYTIRKPFS